MRQALCASSAKKSAGSTARMEILQNLLYFSSLHSAFSLLKSISRLTILKGQSDKTVMFQPEFEVLQMQNPSYQKTKKNYLASNAASRFSTVFRPTRRSDSSVEPAMCNVAMKLLSESRGFLLSGGSCSNTSLAAPAMQCESSARNRSCSFTIPPRDVFTSSRAGFATAKMRSFTRFFVSAVSDTLTLTMSIV